MLLLAILNCISHFGLLKSSLPRIYFYLTLLNINIGRKTFYKGDYQHHGRPIPDTEENRRIKEWDAQTALAKLEEEIWFKKL